MLAGRTLPQVRLALFFAASASILKLSWRALGDWRTHGFYRFFAFELLTALVLWNAPVWFRHPFSVRQLASYLLDATSIALAIEGFRLLHKIGRPSRSAARDPQLGFENTTTLVAVGA